MSTTPDYPENVPSATQGEAVSVAAPGLVGAGGTTLEDFQRWLETKAHKSSALIQATEPRFCFAQDVYLDESLVIAECRVATKLLMQFKLEQGA